jgi:hypothetical protein
VKRKLPSRLKSKLRKKLLPEIDLQTLSDAIAEFLDTPAGKSARGKNLVNILASYLAQKYSVTDRKSGEVRSLIERHTDDITTFLDGIRFKEFQALAGTPAGHPPPTSLKESVQALLKPPDKLPPSPNEIPLPENEPPPKKRRRPRPKTEAERKRRQKEAKNRYEESRRYYRRGLIIDQFGTYAYPTLYPQEATPPEGACLDIIFRGGAVSKAAHWGSLEDLFGIDRHRFPNSPGHERNGRNRVYYLDEFVECLIHLLANRDGKEQWLPEGPQRQLVLTGIIARSRQFSPKIADMLTKKLCPYLS